MFPDAWRSISPDVASLNILVHDIIDLIYYEHWLDKQKYFYLYWLKCHTKKTKCMKRTFTMPVGIKFN